MKYVLMGYIKKYEFDFSKNAFIQSIDVEGCYQNVYGQQVLVDYKTEDVPIYESEIDFSECLQVGQTIIIEGKRTQISNIVSDMTGKKTYVYVDYCVKEEFDLDSLKKLFRKVNMALQDLSYNNALLGIVEHKVDKDYKLKRGRESVSYLFNKKR